MLFPKGFTWGAAAAAYQLEGAAAEDGRGPSVWDMFCRQDKAIFSNHTGDVACDHYHRFEDDIALMKQIGLQAYRLSISWSRLLPAGTGLINDRGFEFYDRLIDGLLDAGITPFVTLYHWDMPYELYCRGGWLNPSISQWFADYTTLVAQRYGDRVKHWMTLNEPQCYLTLGHQMGVHAPGLKLGWHDVLRCVHHSLISHGRAVQMLREHCKIKPIIGWAPVGEVKPPYTDSPADVAASRARTMSASKRDLWNNTLFSDPICLGHYPEDALRAWGRDFAKVSQKDLDTIKQPIDFYGVNIYRGQPVKADENGSAVEVEDVPGAPTNAMQWSIQPQALYWGPKFIYERYGLPMYITENGFAGYEWVDTDGMVRDPQRIDYTRRYLGELSRAIAEGIDVRGYFHWSLMDNFEWSDGYRPRFGLVHVDYQTQQRRPKESAMWYSRVIHSNGGHLREPRREALRITLPAVRDRAQAAEAELEPLA